MGYLLLLRHLHLDYTTSFQLLGYFSSIENRGGLEAKKKKKILNDLPKSQQ